MVCDKNKCCGPAIVLQSDFEHYKLANLLKHLCTNVLSTLFCFYQPYGTTFKNLMAGSVLKLLLMYYRTIIVFTSKISGPAYLTIYAPCAGAVKKKPVLTGEVSDAWVKILPCMVYIAKLPGPGAQR